MIGLHLLFLIYQCMEEEDTPQMCYAVNRKGYVDTYLKFFLGLEIIFPRIGDNMCKIHNERLHTCNM